MAKDDYHVIVYQILSYLYVRLKSGEPVEVDGINYDCKNFLINKRYWQYIMINLLKDGYIEGITAEERHYVSGPQIVINDLECCQITPKGIDYLIDNSLLAKAKDLVDSAAAIAPLVELIKK